MAVKEKDEENAFEVFDELQGYIINLAELLSIISDSNASGKYALEEKITDEIDQVMDILIATRNDKTNL